MTLLWKIQFSIWMQISIINIYLNASWMFIFRVQKTSSLIPSFINNRKWLKKSKIKIQTFNSCRTLSRKSQKTLPKWRWWRTHMKNFDKIFYVHLINTKVRHCLSIFQKIEKITIGKNFHNHFPIHLQKYIMIILYLFSL